MKDVVVDLTKQGNILSWNVDGRYGGMVSLRDDFNLDQCETSFSSGRLEIRINGRLVVAGIRIEPQPANSESYRGLSDKSQAEVAPLVPPRLGERVLLLILRTKEERANIPGDLEEEFRQIAAKHGARYARVWYYKQVAASAWPMVRKAAGWGLLASVGAWIRGRL